MIMRLFFALAAIAAMSGAIMTVAAKNPIRGAMALLLSIVGVVGMLVGLSAQFLAVVELIVYAGAVVVLFVFVIMLIGPEPPVPVDWRGIVARAVAGLAAGAGAVSVAIAVAKMPGTMPRVPAAHRELGTIEMFARELFTRGLLPFEIMTVLFVVAVVGAMALARKDTKPPSGPAASAKEQTP
jgi:NADH-quinone oxidoreductase subunit J